VGWLGWLGAGQRWGHAWLSVGRVVTSIQHNMLLSVQCIYAVESSSVVVALFNCYNVLLFTEHGGNLLAMLTRGGVSFCGRLGVVLFRESYKQLFVRRERHTPNLCQKGLWLIFQSQKGGPNVSPFVFWALLRCLGNWMLWWNLEDERLRGIQQAVTLNRPLGYCS
jgi:hypothetical protein